MVKEIGRRAALKGILASPMTAKAAMGQGQVAISGSGMNYPSAGRDLEPKGEVGEQSHEEQMAANALSRMGRNLSGRLTASNEAVRDATLEKRSWSPAFKRHVIRQQQREAHDLWEALNFWESGETYARKLVRVKRLASKMGLETRYKIGTMD